jgi:hypothetical protein
MISNLEWFKQYIFYRKCLLISCVIWLIFIVITNYYVNNPILEKLLYVYPISIVVTVMKFDWTQKPSYISIYNSENGFKIELFIPDTRYHVSFNEKYIRKYQFSLEESPKFIIKKGYLQLLDKISVQIKLSGQEIVVTPFLSFSWGTKVDINNLRHFGEVIYC